MNPNRRGVLVSVVVTFVALVAIAWIQPAIRSERDSLEISIDSERNARIPADLALINAALGGFRSWAINFMWLRATKLQEEQRVHEAAQLARWITNLSPRFERVWTFQAWNMAFNISRHADNDRDRWRWVVAGLDLLRGSRDSGLSINPLSLHIHAWLSYCFWFKIGGDMDESHRYYKQAHADEWHRTLGGPSTSESGNRRRAVLDRFRPVAVAPRFAADLIADDPRFANYFEQISELDYDLDRALLWTLTSEEIDSPTTNRGRAITQVRTDMVTNDCFDSFIAFLRAKVLRDHYSMDPHLMLDMIELLGPFDWRHEASQGAYWIVQGTLRREKQKREVRLVASEPEFLVVMHRPELLICLRRLALESGRMFRDDSNGRFRRIPEPLFLRAYEQSRFSGGVSESRDLFRSDLELATATAFFFGEEETAERYHQRLRLEFGAPDTVEAFVEAQLRAEIDVQVAAGVELFQALKQVYSNAFVRGYGVDQPDVASRFEETSERLYESYAERAPLPPFEELRRATVVDYLTATALVASVPEKSRVWKALAPELRAELGARPSGVGTLLDQLAAWARSAGLEPEEAFPTSP